MQWAAKGKKVQTHEVNKRWPHRSWNTSPIFRVVDTPGLHTNGTNIATMHQGGVFTQRGHSACTAPIITVIIQVTTLKTTYLRNHAQSIQNSKIQTSDACHVGAGGEMSGITPQLNHPAVMLVAYNIDIFAAQSKSLSKFWFNQQPELNSIAKFKSVQLHHNCQYQFQDHHGPTPMGPRDLNSAPYSPVHCSSHSMTSFQSSELTELPVVENSQLFAQRAHSACTAHGTPPKGCFMEYEVGIHDGAYDGRLHSLSLAAKH